MTDRAADLCCALVTCRRSAQLPPERRPIQVAAGATYDVTATRSWQALDSLNAICDEPNA
jgi:hypothetical protein